MARPSTQTDLERLVRAYGVLAGTCDAERVIVGPVSRAWIATEVEHAIPLNELPAELLSTRRGHDIIAHELYPDEDIDPQTLDIASLDQTINTSNCVINSNRIPKLEPRINSAVLTANILLGVRLYGRHGKGSPDISNDLIVAAMLQDALEKPYVFSALSSGDYEIIDRDYLTTWFGPKVAALCYQIQEALDLFSHSVVSGQSHGNSHGKSHGISNGNSHGKSFNPDSIPGRIHTVIAAIAASRLRLTARAAGDSVISFLPVQRHDELAAAGVDVSSPFPELPFLQRNFEFATAAFKLPHVDHYALREPLENTLLIAVQDVLEDHTKRDRLSGRRGKAVHEVHINLPVMEYYVAAESPNSLDTIHLASLEMMRSLDKGRRKSLSTMTGHAFRISALAERVLGYSLEPIVITLALLHDVVEDGAMNVTGFGQSLRKIMFRFGAPMAAMVSELTDSKVATAGEEKARKTLEHPYLLSPEQQYNANRFTQMEVTASDLSQPYTLTGIVVKLLDTVVSLEEGIRDPELMTSWWRHSGARIYWAENQRGKIIHPLIERLVQELSFSQQDPEYVRRPHRITRSRLKAGRALLELTLSYLDLYAVQNLGILCDEYGLDSADRERVLRVFFDPNVNAELFRESIVHSLFTESKLQASISAGRVPSRAYVTLYKKQCLPTDTVKPSTFMAYREHAIRRHAIRVELGFDTPSKISAQLLKQQQVLTMYDQKMAGTELRLPLDVKRLA